MSKLIIWMSESNINKLCSLYIVLLFMQMACQYSKKQPLSNPKQAIDTTCQLAFQTLLDGSQRVQGVLINGNKTGTWMTYFEENGALYSCETFDKGQLSGAFTVFKDSKKVDSAGYIQNGHKKGIKFYYNRYGLSHKRAFEDNQLDSVLEAYNFDGSFCCKILLRNEKETIMFNNRPPPPPPMDSMHKWIQ